MKYVYHLTIAKNIVSPSMRRVWIEIARNASICAVALDVTLHAEGVD